MYAITANAETITMGSGSREWRGSVQIPTFYLDENVQGILSETHAKKVAGDIIDPLRIFRGADRLHITAVKV